MTTAPSVEELQALDASIDHLAGEGDFLKLEPLLADDFIYSHSTGHVQDKTEWIEGLKPLVGRRLRVASNIKAEIHGDVAVTYGDLDVVWTDGSVKYNRYVRIFRETNGSWLLISQRTVPGYDRAPEEAAH